jgi:hypothetical protein
LQILEQKEDDEEHGEHCTLIPKRMYHTKFYVRFAPTSLCKPDAKGFTGKSPSGYFGNLDMDCPHTSNISINDSLQNKVHSIPLMH